MPEADNPHRLLAESPPAARSRQAILPAALVGVPGAIMAVGNALLARLDVPLPEGPTPPPMRGSSGMSSSALRPLRRAWSCSCTTP